MAMHETITRIAVIVNIDRRYAHPRCGSLFISFPEAGIDTVSRVRVTNAHFPHRCDDAQPDVLYFFFGDAKSNVKVDEMPKELKTIHSEKSSFMHRISIGHG
jgi:hypothetical protein